MIPLRDNQARTTLPAVNWTLVALNIVVYVWDRNGGLFGPSVSFADLAMRPQEVVQAAIPGHDHFALVTVFTSMFLHGGLMHLVGNMIFLTVVGSAVEEALGSWRYALYYLFWGVAAAAAQTYVDPNSSVPTLGASGAIGGVLGAYFLLFPANKIQVIVPWMPFWQPVVSAWMLLGIWFLWQILVPQE